jgi:hypothetical protein
VRPFGGGRVLFRHDAMCRFGRSDLPRPTAKRSTRMSLSRWRQELLSNYFGSNELVNSHSPLQASCCRCGCSRLHSLAPCLGVQYGLGWSGLHSVRRRSRALSGTSRMPRAFAYATTTTARTRGSRTIRAIGEGLAPPQSHRD